MCRGECRPWRLARDLSQEPLAEGSLCVSTQLRVSGNSLPSDSIITPCVPIYFCPLLDCGLHKAESICLPSAPSELMAEVCVCHVPVRGLGRALDRLDPGKGSVLDVTLTPGSSQAVATPFPQDSKGAQSQDPGMSSREHDHQSCLDPPRDRLPPLGQDRVQVRNAGGAHGQKAPPSGPIAAFEGGSSSSNHPGVI